MLTTIKNIRNTQGSNAKMAALKQADSGLLRKVLLYTYNPFCRYNIKKIPAFSTSGANTNTLEGAFALLDDLKNRVYTGNNAINTLSVFMSNMTADDAELLAHIIDRDLKFGLNTKSINKVFPNLIPEFEVMLAEAKVPIEKLLAENEFLYVQKKMDGKRCVVVVKEDSVDFYARSGKEMENLYKHEGLITSLKTARQSYLKFDFVLDGELIMKEADGTEVERKISNGAINRKDLSQEMVDKFHLVVWDILSLDEFENDTCEVPYEERLYLLLFALQSNFQYVDVVETFTAGTEDEVNQITNDYIADGFEGSVVKTPQHFYVKKRSKDWVKFKGWNEADLKVVAFNYGTPGSKYDGMLGALSCESSDGVVKVDVGTGFTDEMRATIKEDVVGKIITVQYNELITNSLGNTSMFLPVFIEIRDDKQVADSYEKIKKNG